MDRKVVLKLNYEGRLRRVGLKDRPVTFSEVQFAVCSIFPEIAAYMLSYLDDEGDRITVSSDFEMQEAYELALEASPHSSAAVVIRLDLEPAIDTVPLSSVIPMHFIRHPFSKRIAEITLEMETTFGVERIMTLCAFHFPGFDHHAQMGRLPVWRAIAHSLIQGNDIQIPTDVAVCLRAALTETIGDFDNEMRHSFDRMENGFLAFQQANISAPRIAILSSLWFANGDADEAMKLFQGVAGMDLMAMGPDASMVSFSSFTSTASNPQYDPAFMHPAKCDQCSKRIFGVRYKCLCCADYDLCERCQSKLGNAHPIHHPFVKLTSATCSRIASERLRLAAQAAAAAKVRAEIARAKAQAEEEARVRAEEEARAKATADAKAKAEQRRAAALHQLVPLGFDEAVLRAVLEETEDDIELTLEQFGIF